MSDREHPRAAELRSDYFAALQEANKDALSPEAFMSVFPPKATEGHREILSRLLQNLVELVERGYQQVFDSFLQTSNVGNQFLALDRATLNDETLAGAMSDVSDDVTLERLADGEPIDNRTQARITSKRAEIARLEVVVKDKEADLANDRAEVANMYSEYRQTQEDILTRLQATVETTQILAGSEQR
jgi:hypothetical protein